MDYRNCGNAHDRDFRREARLSLPVHACSTSTLKLQ